MKITLNKVLLGVFAVSLAWSAVNPHDYFTWLLEVAPALIGLAIVLATHKRFKLTGVLYVLLVIHAVILMYGGKHTYALNPLFDWIKDVFSLERNYYDRLGHFAQGFVPAILTREVLLRTSPIKKGKWLLAISTCIPLAFSAFYEMIEWWVAVATGEAAESFLGTQGDIWDTQWDMFLCLIGAVTALLLLSRVHDRAIERLSKSSVS